MGRYLSVFKDESKLDINYVPPRLPHRGPQLDLLNKFFRFIIESPGKMTQRVLIVGKVGTGKTVLVQRFGLSIAREAQERGTNLHYVHINCRECKGSLFIILHRIITKFYPNFPRRGYSEVELLQMLMQVLDERNVYLILVMDELESLIRSEGSDPIYSLTRIQEDRVKAPQRLSLICILREPECLDKLDASTRSTLQRNIIHMEEYSASQLQDILNDRVALAFRHGAVSTQTIGIISELAAEEGDARYAIELLWRAGKYADVSESPEVLPEYVRKAAVSVYPVVRKDSISSLSLHEKLFLLGVARRFKQTEAAHLSMGEAKDSYAIVCEEWSQKKRGHTQLWKYVRDLSALGIIKIEPSSVGQRGKTTLISLPRVPASDLERELSKALSKNRM
jgi:cell division control protein 6